MSRRAVALAFTATLLVAGSPVACADSPGRALQETFGTGLPARVGVVRHADSGLGMDHADIWELAPVDDAFLTDLTAAARLRRRLPDEPLVSGLASDAWPAWWDARRIEALPEAYSRDGDREYRRVWVDRGAGRIYVQWFDT